ncbi:hypothetical protein Y032_0135g1938 [Ancylostoma ceylanicum]|uniref:Copper transport protein n=1 Tax=Ancylostoma ceylanicum TaxID=53326 RepID=A0A016T5U3_9BILA|nr:hypothetical protein Y032_0135g1938 [Ancylostoma ceylanicum]
MRLYIHSRFRLSEIDSSKPVGMHGGGRKMWMWFHTHVNDTLLFKNWWIHDAGTMVWSCIIIAVLAVGLEALRWLRWVAQVRRAEEKT